MVAATFEKALTYESAEPLVWDREVGGSNPLAPTIHINTLRLPTLAAVSLVQKVYNQNSETHIFVKPHGTEMSHRRRGR